MSMMPYGLGKRIKHLVGELEANYGNYAKYTDLLDELHTLIINDAQSFKPKRVYKRRVKRSPELDFMDELRKGLDDESTSDTPLVGAPDT